MVNHAGLTVGDADRAVSWYADVFGFRSLGPPKTVDRSSPGQDRRDAIFGERFGVARLAHLVGENGTGLELFEFVDPPVEIPDDLFPFWRVGLHHLAITVDEVGAAAARVSAGGGRMRTGVLCVADGCEVCYVEDPWGNVLELTNVVYSELGRTWQRAIQSD